MEPVSQQQYSTPQMQQPSVPSVPQPNVSFPTAKPKSGSKLKWVILVIVVLVVLGIAGWFLMKGRSGSGSEPTPSPESGVLSSFATPTPEPTPEPTEEPKAPVSKSEVKVMILNGTGTPGDASLVKTALTKLGYEDIEAANADSQDEERTTVTFARELDTATIDEITKALEEIFTEVRVRKGSLADGVSVNILTGPKKGASASTASPTPGASATPTATPAAE